MEVKDINNATTLAMLTRGNGAAANAGFVGDAFSSLLDTQVQIPDFSKEIKFAAQGGMSAEKLSSSENVNNNVPEKNIDNKKDKNPVQDKEKSEPEKTEAKDTSRPEEDRQAENKENRPTEKNEAENTDENSDEDDGKKVNAAVLPDLSLLFMSESQSVVSTAEVPLTSENTTVQSVQSAPAMNIRPEALETEMSATAFSPAETVSGAAEQKSSGTIDISSLQMVTEETVVEMAATAPEMAGTDKTAGKGKIASTLTSAALPADSELPVMSDDLSEPVAKLADLNLNSEEIKLDVKIKDAGENFSYRKTSDLTAMATADMEIKADDVKPEEGRFRLFGQSSAEGKGSAQNFVQNPNMPAQQSAGAQPVQNPAFNAVTAASSGNNTDIAAEVTKNATTEVKSVQMAQAAGGSEFVNAAKARTAEQLKSPVNDTYKGMSRETVEQVKVNITKSAVKGVDKIDISLKPEELGHIEIKMHLAKNGKLQAEIIASRPETMEMLQKEAQNLQRSFEDAGFQTDENSLSFSCREDNAQSGQQERNYEMRRFIGEALDGDFSNDNLSGYAESSWDGQSGLNIRV